MWSTLGDSLMPTKVLPQLNFFRILKEKAIGTAESYFKSQAAVYHKLVFYPLGRALQTGPHLTY